MKIKLLSAAFAVALSGGATMPAFAQSSEVNIYSLRQTYLIQPLLDAFTKKTGVTTNVIFADKGLIERIAEEAENSPADLLLTADIGFLTSAVEQGITQPIESGVVEENIPAVYRDPEGDWVGLTSRARVIYASKERVEQDSITYEELANPKWKGKICTRSGQHSYNLALFASMIAHKGEAEAKKWLEGLKENLARKPSGNDRAQAQGVFSGECDLAIANTYYMALMATNEKEPEQQEWARSVKVLFPNAEERGTHVNLSGVVLAKNAPNKDNAIKLIEFLTSDEAQKIYAELNNEYPLKEGVGLSQVVASWGELKADELPLATIGETRKRASELVDEVGYDQGPNS
ncbi:MAG: Fe(3+) ABC transporter substrate-binding protein [Hyphomicrobiales bacterium]|nr:Fe(3+) ABC transporter substrate-binding protein [Hyphomicrobiales bacterium]